MHLKTMNPRERGPVNKCRHPNHRTEEWLMRNRNIFTQNKYWDGNIPWAQKMKVQHSWVIVSNGWGQIVSVLLQCCVPLWRGKRWRVNDNESKWMGPVGKFSQESQNEEKKSLHGKCWDRCRLKEATHHDLRKWKFKMRGVWKYKAE